MTKEIYQNKNNPKILLVEDEKIVALDIRRHLERFGYRVTNSVDTGEEAIKRCEEEVPDLILMDIMLKGKLDGVETAGIIKEKHLVPIVFLTAYADDITLERAKVIEPFGYLIKPFEERELKSTIEMALYKSGIDRKLYESEEKYRRLFEEDLAAVCILSREGNIIDCNPSFLAIFKYTKKDALGSSIRPRFKQHDAWGMVLEELFQGKPMKLKEFEMKTKEEEDLTVLANIIATENSKGVIQEIKGFFLDVTDLKLLETRLQQSQKMEAIGRLAGGIAHDFNNILTIILGYISLIKEKLKDREPIDTDMLGIEKASKKAVNLTRQLLAFSRRQKLHMHQVNINSLIKEMEKMLRRIITEQISFYFYLTAKNPQVLVDPGQMEQVIINLMVNARDSIHSTGSISIETEDYTVEKAESSILGEIPPGNYVSITLRDTGAGMDREELQKIFEPFYTTKQEEQGTGLGLSTVLGIVDQSHGHIRVESRKNVGSSFMIFLPRHSGAGDKKKRAADESPEDVETPGGRETILLVEDDPDLRKMACGILSRRGYRVFEAANAGEAILISEKEELEIDLIISDVYMPHLSGPELIKRLKRERPEMKLLLMSGYPNSIEKDDLFNGEISMNFIKKPFTTKDLLEKIRSILD